MGNEHLSGGALVLSSGKNLGFLDIVLSRTAATIDVIVRDENDRPFVGATIARVPEKHLRERFDLYDSVTTDQYGRFTMSGIAPGQYTLFAWDKVESDDYEDPTFLKRYDEQGEQVQLLENQHATASLKVIKTGSQGN